MEQENSSVVIRSQVIHDKKTETDIYMTKNSIITSLIPKIQKIIHKHHFVDLHSLGAANYKALKLALLIKKAYPKELETDIKTETVGTNDFFIPTTPDESQTIKHRDLNAVHIHIYQKL